MSCVFCDIANGEKDADIVWENDAIVVFKDIQPSAPVHLLVVPKTHIESVDALADEHRDVAAMLLYVARDVARTEGLSGYKLVFNVGRAGGQVIDHLYLHLLGGWKEGERPAVRGLDV